MSSNMFQSAGAGSAETHVLFPASTSLFRAAIFDSATGPLWANHLRFGTLHPLKLLEAKIALPQAGTMTQGSHTLDF